MSYESPFGVPEGLGRRLNTWANQLSRDKAYPWVGTGLIADLKCAAKKLGAPDFDTMFPAVVAAPPPEPEIEDWERNFAPPAAPVEFDL